MRRKVPKTDLAIDVRFVPNFESPTGPTPGMVFEVVDIEPGDRPTPNKDPRKSRAPRPKRKK